MTTSHEMPTTNLEDLRSYATEKIPLWIESGHEGEWVIVGPELTVLGFFPSYHAAYFSGARAYGDSATFLIEQVLRQQKIEQIQLLGWA